jgi:hypothetical protein
MRHSLGARQIDCREGKHHPDDRRQGDSRKITENYRWRADADGNFPQVENGMRDEPQRGGGPQPNAALRFVACEDVRAPFKMR